MTRRAGRVAQVTGNSSFANFTWTVKILAATVGNLRIQDRMTNQVRLAGLLGFVLGMPVLAIPAVNGGIERWWNGPDDATAYAEVSHTPARLRHTDDDLLEPETGDTTTRKSESGDNENSTEEGSASPPPPVAPSAPPPAPPLNRLPDTAQEPVTDRSSNSFGEMQQRLRALGCTQWRLEAVPEDEELVRFTCQVPLPGHDSYQRTFTADARDPMDAMAQTMDQIDQWRKAHVERPARPAALVESTRAPERPVERVRMIKRPPAIAPTK